MFTLYLPGADSLIHFIDSQVAADGSASSSTYPLQVLVDMSRKMIEYLPAHGVAFDRGLISCERLMEVLVRPFLKLTHKYSREEPSPMLGEHRGQNMGTTERFFLGWSMVLGHLLGEGRQGSQHEIRPELRTLRTKKRQDLVKALLAAKFPEVCHS